MELLPLPQAATRRRAGGQVFREPIGALCWGGLFSGAALALLAMAWKWLFTMGIVAGLLIGVPLLGLTLVSAGIFLLSAMGLFVSALPEVCPFVIQDEGVLFALSNVASDAPHSDAPLQLGDPTHLALDFDEIMCARRALIKTIKRGEDLREKWPDFKDYLELHVTSAVAGQLEDHLTKDRVVRLPWLGPKALKALEAAGVEIAKNVKVTHRPPSEVSHRPPPLNLEPIRKEVQRLVDDGKAKDAHKLMISSPALAALPATEMKEFLNTIELAKKAA